MIERTDYINRLKSFRDQPMIKVATGIRRCGKSTLFEQFIDFLKSTGVEDSQIIHMKMTDGEHDYITDHSILYKEVNNRLEPNRQNYVFLDEVQEVDGFEKAINALFEKKNAVEIQEEAA